MSINVIGLAYLGTWRIPRADWPRFLVAGLVGMAGYNWFVNAGFELVPAGLGTIITMVEPLMIALLAALLLGEKLNRFIFIGVVIATLGAIVLFWEDLTTTQASSVPPLGILYLMICCLCWAIYTIVAKPLLDRYDSFTVTAITMLIAAPPLIGAASEPLTVLAARLDLRQWARAHLSRPRQRHRRNAAVELRQQASLGHDGRHLPLSHPGRCRGQRRARPGGAGDHLHRAGRPAHAGRAWRPRSSDQASSARR